MPPKALKRNCLCFMALDDSVDQQIREHRIKVLLDPRINEVDEYLTVVRIWATVRRIEKWQGEVLKARSRKAIRDE